MQQIRRALLFMPGDSRRKIEKAAGLSVDAIIMDLEDAIAPINKQIARETVTTALHELDFGHSERLVRTNMIIPGWLYQDDIRQTVSARPDGYVLPKIEEARQVQHVSSILTDTEERHGWPLNSIKLLAIVETAKGVVNLREIASSDPRLDALIFGAEDLAGNIGARRTAEGHEVAYARSAVVIHAKAFHLQAIDTVFVDLHAPEAALLQETRKALEMGYTGKLAIHPRQVGPMQGVFTPTTEEIDAAQRLISAHQQHQVQGSGVFEYEGRMVDMPMIRSALYIVATARACGLLP